MSIIETLIETQEFATLPPVATRVLKLLEDDNVDIRDLASIIEADASLTLKLLRVANSPLYATRTEVSSIQQAIVTLGLNRLTNIVLGVSIFSKFLLSSQHQAAEYMEKFWWHASCTGMVAKSLTRKLGINLKEFEFIGGLLHDIGKLAMIQFDAEKYFEVVEIVQNEKIKDEEAEMRVYGANHTQVGAEISRLWKLPHELSNVITYHTNPEESDSSKGLLSIVRLADILCEIWGADFYEGFLEVSISDCSAWEELKKEYPALESIDIEQLTFELEQDFQNSAAFLNIIVQDS